MNKDISDNPGTLFDWSELQESQCEQLGWCSRTHCGFDDREDTANATHFGVEYGHTVDVQFENGQWGPVEVLPEELSGDPFSLDEARDYALRLVLACTAAEVYQRNLPTTPGQVA